MDLPTSEPSDSKQTLDGFSPNPSPHPRLMETLDDPPNSAAIPLEPNAKDSSNCDSAAIASGLNANDSPNCDYLSAFSDETLDDQSDSAFYLDVESEEDEEDTDILHSSPVNTVSAFSSSHWSSTPWSVREETETKPTVSVSPAWCSEIKLAMVGAGLANLGNTCFLNAVLQCFTHTVPLVRGLLSVNHPRPCDCDSEGCCMLCALREHIELSLASMGRVVLPWKLVDNLSYISSDFRRFQQEDAHEFLQCLLDRLDSCCTHSKLKDMTSTSEDENLVKQVFGGRLISKVRCCNCGHCSDTYEPLVDLSLEIENVGTLPGALESFTKVEKIEDPETQFTCEKCKERVSIEKQLMLDLAPSVAAFHLKRFKNDGSFVEKIDKNVEFPLELDLLPYTSGSQKNNVELKYDLYAVVVHTGISSTSGHYYCFVRSAKEAWYRLDDSKVFRVREDFVLSQEAYILFYAKHGTPWFTTFVETEMSYLYQHISNNSPKSVLDNMDNIYTSSPNVANTYSCEIKKAREEVIGISAESIKGLEHDNVKGNEAKDDPHRLFTPVPLGMCSSSNGSSDATEKKFSPSALNQNNCNQEFNGVKNSVNISPSEDGISAEVQKKFSPSALKENNCNQEFNEVKNNFNLTPSDDGISGKVEKKFSQSALKENNCNQEFNEVKNRVNITPTMPLRSPSPDIYAEEPPGPVESYSIPRDHLMSEKQMPCKRQLGKDQEDAQRKEARKLLKHMPNGRSTKLLAALNGSSKDGSLNGKKSRRKEMPSTGNNRHSSTSNKTNLNSFLRPVAAGSFR